MAVARRRPRLPPSHRAGAAVAAQTPDDEELGVAPPPGMFGQLCPPIEPRAPVLDVEPWLEVELELVLVRLDGVEWLAGAELPDSACATAAPVSAPTPAMTARVRESRGALIGLACWVYLSCRKSTAGR